MPENTTDQKIKPGWKTTEFWVTVAVPAIAAVYVGAGLPTTTILGHAAEQVTTGAPLAIVGAGIAAGLYALARAWLKSKVAPKPPAGAVESVAAAVEVLKQP